MATQLEARVAFLKDGSFTLQPCRWAVFPKVTLASGRTGKQQDHARKVCSRQSSYSKSASSGRVGLRKDKPPEGPPI